MEKSSNELDRLHAKWQQHGADVVTSLSRRTITLSRLVIPKHMRGQGLGSGIMHQLVSFAAERELTIGLSPSIDFGATSKSRLETFYGRFGFVRNKGRNRDFASSESMLLVPPPPDVAYAQFVTQCDSQAAARMVLRNAKESGYSVGPVWHGTNAEFSVFRANSWFAVSEDLARVGGVRPPNRLICACLNISPMRLSDDQMDSFRLSTAVSVDSPDKANKFALRLLRQSQADSLFFPGYGYLVADPARITSVAPIERDSNGGLIPLSKRASPGIDSSAPGEISALPRRTVVNVSITKNGRPPSLR